MATESVTNTAREEMLRRIRLANGGGSGGRAAAEAGWGAIHRAYRRVGRLDCKELPELLQHRLRDYDAGVMRAANDDVARCAANLLHGRSVRRMLAPAGLPAAWRTEGVEWVEDEGLTAAALDGVDGVMTGATVAIAETGTVVVQTVAAQGRRAATLVPDYHLCVVRIEDVVETVAEAMTRLQATAAVATTFISGPSATADIEMTRIKGVHGPRFLDVILVG